MVICEFVNLKRICYERILMLGEERENFALYGSIRSCQEEASVVMLLRKLPRKPNSKDGCALRVLLCPLEIDELTCVILWIPQSLLAGWSQRREIL